MIQMVMEKKNYKNTMRYIITFLAFIVFQSNSYCKDNKEFYFLSDLNDSNVYSLKIKRTHKDCMTFSLTKINKISKQKINISGNAKAIFFDKDPETDEDPYNLDSYFSIEYYYFNKKKPELQKIIDSSELRFRVDCELGSRVYLQLKPNTKMNPSNEMKKIFLRTYNLVYPVFQNKNYNQYFK